MYEEWKFSEGLDKLIIEFKDLGLDDDAIIRRLAQKIHDMTIVKVIGQQCEHMD